MSGETETNLLRRAMRDYTEGSGLMHEEFNYTVSTANSSLIHLHRKNVNHAPKSVVC